MLHPDEKPRFRATMLFIALGLGLPIVVIEVALGHDWPWKAAWLLTCALAALWLRSREQLPRRSLQVALAVVCTALGPASVAAGSRSSVELLTIGAMPVIAAVLFIERFDLVVGITVCGWLANTALFATSGMEARDVVSISARLAAGAVVVCATAWWNRSVRRRQRAREEEHQQTLRSSEMRRAQAERLAMVGRLAAGVAHEINNPLAFVKANVGALDEHLAQRTPLERPELELLLSDTRAGIERIHQIVLDLKTWAREDGEKSEVLDLEELTRSAVRLAAVRLPRGMRVQVDFPPGVPKVRANGRKLAQILLNLLINAGDAIEESKSGSLVEPQITIVATVDGDRVNLFVRDNGPGLSSAARERLFEPFFTTKPPGRGTGLGLALSREYAESFGGSLSLEETTAGASFRISMRGA